ncbi:MAG: SDR family NAD(P)-dependent oxidoreductase [Bacteroidales bacterium]
MEEKNYTLITGASRGLGKALAMECAKRGQNLILVASNSHLLSDTATQITDRYKVEARYFAIDLTTEHAAQKVFEWCKSNQYIVNVLINNAALTGISVFDASVPEYYEKLIDLNIKTLTILCRLFIPEFRKLNNAYILNMGSMAAYFPFPYKSVYSASKAYLLNFSKSINSELKGTGISVTVINPNGVYTSDEIFERIKAHGFMGRLLSVTPERLAEISIDALFKRKEVCVPKRANRILLGLNKLLPESYVNKLVKKEFRKELMVINNKD